MFHLTLFCYSVQSFDQDNSGSIDRTELQNALQTFGYRLTPSTIDLMLKKFDRQGRGTIAFDDFIQCCVTLHVRQSQNVILHCDHIVIRQILGIK